MRAEVRARLEQLEHKAKWKELFYPNGQSRGKFAASPWTENIYPWLKAQLEWVLGSGGGEG